MISPADFIPIAEQTGMIVAMGEWALRQACKDAANWPEPVNVTVNLSSVQFEQGDLLKATRHALQQSGLAAERLELEITESVLLGDAPKTQEILRELHELGVQIALDDFGTAFASLSYLQSFPFDKLKIDRSFVREIPERADCLAIVQAVTNLARNLRMDTVAEGIETREHFASVSGMGCDEVARLLFQPPGSGQPGERGAGAVPAEMPGPAPWPSAIAPSAFGAAAPSADRGPLRSVPTKKAAGCPAASLGERYALLPCVIDCLASSGRNPDRRCLSRSPPA